MNKSEYRQKLLLITYGVVLLVCLLNYNFIGGVLKYLFKLIYPFIIGGIIAFILNVLVRMIEEGLLKKLKKTIQILQI